MKKELIAKKNSSIEHFRGEDSLIQHYPVYRKQISAWGMLMIFGVWSLVIFTAGYKLSNKSDKQAKELAHLQERLKSIESQNQASIDEYKFYIKSQLNDLDHKLKKQFDAEKVKLEEEISKISYDQSEKLESLKNEIDYQKFKKKNLPSQKKTIAFSQKNLDIMFYEHGLKVQRLKSLHRARENDFVSEYNLENPNYRAIFSKIKEQHKVELFALERELREKRSHFRKNKYFVKR